MNQICRWDEQNALLVESHERVIQELTEEYETKLHDEHMNLQGLQQEREELEREFEEIKRQLEEDADREIEELKERYEQRLVYSINGSIMDVILGRAVHFQMYYAR